MYGNEKCSKDSIPEIPVLDKNQGYSIYLCKQVFDRLKSTIFEYCSIGCMDGLFYLTVHGILNRILWFILFILSLIGCYFVTASLFDAREIITLNEQSTVSTYDIPFPAVTVCTTIKADHRFVNYPEAYKHADWGQATEHEQFISVLFKRVLWQMSSSPHSGNRQLDSEVENIEERIFNISIPEKSLIPNCTFNKEKCDWSRILTPEGVCYSFNLLSSEDMFLHDRHQQYITKKNRVYNWNLIDGYENSRYDAYPFRGFIDNILHFRLQINLLDTINSKTPNNGFKIYIGHPVDYPYLEDTSVFIPLNVETTLSITPDIMTASDELKYYSLKNRQCLLKKDNWTRMDTFREYSMNNCRLECIAKKTVQNCECTPFYVPSISRNHTCGMKLRDNIYCYHYAISDRFIRDTISIQLMEYNNLICKCIPACSTITYNVQEITKSVIPASNETDIQFCDITVKFSSNEFIPKRRQESYSVLDVMSAIGGTLGLFVGASVMSVIEVFYYFSIKIIINLLTISSKE
uniref:CSON008076 protein n=1 Tax=Culicoides sonorensis TaxID=179676 RepID=A0A336LY76_CULSO